MSRPGWGLSIVLAAALAGALASSGDSANGGSLDQTFGVGGKVLTYLGGYESVRAAALQPDGKLVVVGSQTAPDDLANVRLFMARYDERGRLDGGFGEEGFVVTAFGSERASGLDVAVQPGGRIVVLADTFPAYVLAGYDENGHLDSSFGSGGMVTTRFPAYQDVLPRASALAVDRTGRLAVAGTWDGMHVGHMVAARHEADGAPDPTFGNAGFVSMGPRVPQEGASAVAFQPDGKLLVGGFRRSSHGDYGDGVLARYDETGRFDPTFGSNGVVAFERTSAPGRTVGVIALQADARIVVAGGGSVSRLLADGRPDVSFGRAGVVLIPRTWIADGLVEPDGRIVVAGSKGSGFEFVVVRLEPDGALDLGFGVHGRVETDFGEDDRAVAVQRRNDGRLVLAGRAGQSQNAAVGLAQYRPAHCVVPRLARKRRRAAVAALVAAECRVGVVRQAYSRRVGRGRVLAQRPPPGASLSDRARVDLVVSRGPRRGA